MSERVLEVFTDTISKPLKCGDPECHKEIVFAVLTGSGKRHPFVANYEMQPALLPPVDGRSVTRILQSSSHFVDCPGAKRFSRRR